MFMDFFIKLMKVTQSWIGLKLKRKKKKKGIVAWNEARDMEWKDFNAEGVKRQNHNFQIY